MLMGYVSRDLPLEEIEIQTPITKQFASFLVNWQLFQSLHSCRYWYGWWFVASCLQQSWSYWCVPWWRNARMVEYLVKLPEDIDQRQIYALVDQCLRLVVRPILAVDSLKKHWAANIKICMFGCRTEGVKLQDNSQILLISASLDEKLNENGYHIVPGLGDAGDLCLVQKI